MSNTSRRDLMLGAGMGVVAATLGVKPTVFADGPSAAGATPARAIDDVITRLSRSATVATIVTVGDPILRRPANSVPLEGNEKRLAELGRLMLTTMHAVPGVGLAGPQVGLSSRIAVLGDAAEVPAAIRDARERFPLDDFIAINPQWKPISRKLEYFYEGCLSIPGVQAVVGRFDEIELEYTTPAGRHVSRCLRGWQARIVQHECDHLDGHLYIEKAITESITTNGNYAKRWNLPTLAPAERGLNFNV